MTSHTPIFEAIAKRRYLLATYNRTRFKLAPHILYTRHGEVYVDAVAVSRDGQPPKELKLGSFKVTGMSDLAPIEEEFQPQPVFDPAAERYDGTTLFALE